MFVLALVCSPCSFFGLPSLPYPPGSRNVFFIHDLVTEEVDEGDAVKEKTDGMVKIRVGLGNARIKLRVCDEAEDSSRLMRHYCQIVRQILISRHQIRRQGSICYLVGGLMPLS